MLDQKTMLWPLLAFLARRRQARLAARVLRLMTTRLALPGSSGSRPRYRALALNTNKAGVLQDIEESFRDADLFEVLVWPSYALRPIAAALLSPRLDHNNYLSSDPEIDASKRAYRSFLKDVWKHYCAALPVDVVLAGNFAYFQQREFGAALEESGTPFIAIHKENVRPPKRVKDYWAQIYKERRGPFAGRKILVYNEIERDLEVSCGVSEAKRIKVTGMPRLDRLHRWRRDNASARRRSERPQILFFAFSRQDKLTAPGRKRTEDAGKGRYAIDGEWGSMGWNSMWSQTHEAVVEIARRMPEARVIVKSKGQLHKNTELQEVLGLDEGGLPENVEVIAGGDPFDLITSSDVVVGFNTTGLLEAIAAGKPVIVPKFHEASALDRQDLIIDLGNAVEYATSAEHLVELVCGHAKQQSGISDELPAEARKTLNHWVGNDDGAAGSRVLKAIEEEIGVAADRRTEGSRG